MSSEELTMQWESVIGLEVHTQLLTRSKIFSGARTAFGAEPNSQACAVDLGLPGVLPVLNAEAVRMAVMLGLAIGAKIAPRSIFARKNYFYPDLPKGYQISQYELPVVYDGALVIEDEQGASLRVGIVRAHLEEDAGKSLHEAVPGMTGIDLNRAGTPLLEIVSAPDLRSSAQAGRYLKKLHALVRYLDANVSVRPVGEDRLGTRCEIKNLNSFRFLERAIDYEIARQVGVIEGGGRIVQETRLYDSARDETRPMRSKEEANDYRYFPDPDLLPLVIDEGFVDSVRQQLPELPEQKLTRFKTQYGLGDYDAKALVGSRASADYYEDAVRASGASPKLVANWILGELTAALSAAGADIEDCTLTPARLAGLLTRIEDNTISGKIAKDVFEAMWESGDEADAIIEARGLRQISDDAAIEALVDEVIAKNPQQTGQYRQGKEKLLGYFAGQVMKATQGRVNPEKLALILKRKLAAS
jgi:aspartyl-tRNA(Asn)/glutamyl-tRNA(Gln) amidotransferase subunit B